MLASRPAGRALEELALGYIHDRLAEIINSTAMRRYAGGLPVVAGVADTSRDG